MTILTDVINVTESYDPVFFGVYFGLIGFFAILTLLLNFFWFRKFYTDTPAWHGLIPIWNSFILAKKTFGDNLGWVAFLIFIPYVGTLISIYFTFKIFKSINASTAIAVLSVIFTPFIMIFALLSKNFKYNGPVKSIFS